MAARRRLEHVSEDDLRGAAGVVARAPLEAGRQVARDGSKVHQLGQRSLLVDLGSRVQVDATVDAADGGLREAELKVKKFMA